MDDFPKADWSKLGTRYPRAKQAPRAPLGDPSRWGAFSSFVATVPGSAIRVFQNPQFLRVQANDGYSRSWSLAGTLRAPTAMWAFSNADPIAPAAPGWWASLVVTQGTGQATVVQRLDLRALCTLTEAAGYRRIYDGDINSGGAVVGGFEARPFRLVGSLIGASLAVAVHHLIVTDINPLAASVLETFAELTPLAAGDGL